MSESLVLEATVRTVFGKKVRSLRRQGFTPANIYVKGEESVAIAVPAKEITKIVQTAGKTHPVTIKLDNGSEKLVLIHDYDQNFDRLDFDHVVFFEIKKGEMVEAEVPIVLIGDSPAEKVGKLILVVNDTIEIKGEATHLPDVIEVDKSSLVDDEDNIVAKNIQLPKNIELMSDEDMVIAKVEIPRAQIEEEQAVAAEETSAS